ncbi:CCA tRNA nucleotidyltransferase [Virgifigura deserti]|uniref:CCA tRNA nucleotidyltransferase n=1 Tax=Virgifigura deserti TaxID=2268457 RepID=UPI003CCBA85D
MTAPATRSVVAALTAAGAEIRFVGGCVRDAVLGRPVKDIDIATPDPPDRVMALLAQGGVRAIPTGIAHGTVTALADGTAFEITTLRHDVETFGRHARVAFTDDWAADAARRDLTVNALSCAPDGSLYDPFGGLADLKAGRIRFVGDPEARIREDVLRLLRFFRFYAHYGVPPPDEAALAAARALAPLLPTLSGERIRDELLKLLAAPDPAAVVELMRDQDVLRHIMPEAANPGRLRALVTIEGIVPARLVAGADPLRRLAALLEASAAAAEVVAKRLRLSNAERERLVDLAEPPLVSPDLDRQTRRRLLYMLGAERFRDAALLAWAASITEQPTTTRHEVEAWTDLLATAADWTPPVFPLKGRDFLTLGLKPGPAVGGLLEEIERWWIDNDFAPDRAACLAYARKVVVE